MNSELTFGSWFSGIGGVDSAAEKLGLISKFLEVGECVPTVISTEYKGGLLIIENGNAYKLGVQDFAKLQVFYDDFNFGKRKIIATKGIGNAVPPMIYYKFLKEMI